ncbi:MgtC/SapB family protein [Azospirillum agricola]|uniref:MgtC/SapB family protein n=1 Tax=Azospirillum agricola TaxID=1720247 RepID=UPI000A0F011D|nr:MgtC/SapB family protein [Azospirillum agricola]SMH54488.1 putative Mg2+ transporter-C (MgtC) family protein [Azospirillum lipoferum]
MGLTDVLTLEEIGLRLLAAAFCGALLGLDREMRGKAAGLRTHTLIAISSAVTTLVALEFYSGLAAPGDEGRSDPVRVIQGVAQAVGFISAGVMFRSGDSVRGATTAAVIWVAGSLGIACGAGYYMLAGMGLGLCLAVTIVFSLLLGWFPDMDKESHRDGGRAWNRARSRDGRVRRIASPRPRD